MRSPILSFLIPLLAGVATVAPTRSQCDAQFQPGDPAGAPRGGGSALQVFDPDGSGPLPAQLVIGGKLDDGTTASPVFAYDGTRWRALGTPPAGLCVALAVFNGELIAAIDPLLGITRTDIAAWNGSSWRVLGTTSGQALCMTVFNGRLVIGGVFASFGGVTAANVVQWDGTAWSALGAGVNGIVRALAVYAGALWVGGSISQAGGIPVRNLPTWNGSAWSAGANVDGDIKAMAVLSATSAANAFLFIGGSFNHVETLSAQRVARFNQLNGWVALGGFPAGNCLSLVCRATGQFTFELVAGAFDPASGSSQPVLPHAWNGTTWTELGAGHPDAVRLTVFGGRYVALGRTAVRTLDATRTWVGLGGAGIDGPVMAVAATATDVVIGGSFSLISGVVMNGVARGSVGAWQPLGSGVLGGPVNAIAVMHDGSVIAAGSFDTAGGAPANRIARWNGSAWSPLGPGLGSPMPGTGETVNALAVLADGSLVAGGRFATAGTLQVNHVARWDGTAWTAMAGGFPDTPNVRTGFFCFTLRPDGELLAGGLFPAPAPLLARSLIRWNGSSWATMPADVNGFVTSLTTLRNGDVLVGGRFETVGTLHSPHLARWTGSAFVAVPGFAFSANGYATAALVPMPDGGALVSGQFLDSPSVNSRLARYDGQTVTALPDPSATLVSGTRTSNGDVFFVGDFLRPGNVLSAFVARYVSPCPVRADRYGTGCTGSGGPGELRATQLPLLGSTFAARATGMPVFGLAFAVTGFAQASVPLPTLLPQGQPGCNLLSTADTLEFRPLANGSALSSLSVPASALLVGMVVHHQFVVFELAGVSVVAATSTNGLRLTLGTF